jgi:hypothetical protein
VQDLLAGGTWRWSGMRMSLGPPNPGLSLWAFTALGYLTGAHTAPELAQGVQLLNGLVLVGFVLFIAWGVPAMQREVWLWGAAIWAVNPMAILLERKVWQSSILPLPAVFFVAAWWCRHWRGGGIVLGIAGALLVQVHLVALFFVVAVLVWSWLFEGRAFPWRQWFIGSAVGALPALPWVFQNFGYGGSIAFVLRAVDPTYFLRWLIAPFGLDLPHSLGAQTLDFLAWPAIGGYPTFLMGLAYAGLIALTAFVYYRCWYGLRAAPEWRSPRKLFIGTDPMLVLINAGLWGFGSLLTLFTLFGPRSPRHYLLCVTPLMMLWCARIVFEFAGTHKRAVLGALCALQAFASLGLLGYIHETQIIRGEYGATWRSQQPGFVVQRAAPGGAVSTPMP